MCNPVKSFDERFYVCETCHKHFCKSEILCQVNCNKMALDPMPNELNDLEKVLISNRILFKHQFSKIKGSMCHVPVEAANICNILSRLAVFNGLTVVKLRWDLKYRGLVYFKPASSCIICQALTYLESHNIFYKDNSIAKDLSSEMFRFSNIFGIQGENESVTEKIISDVKEMSESINTESINDTATEYALVEDPLNIHRTASKERTFVSEIPNIINEENVIIAPGQRSKPVLILSDEFCEE